MAIRETSILLNGISGKAFDPPVKSRRNKFALACAILASMNSILLGYDIGVMSGAGIFIKDDLKINDIQLEILMGILNVNSLLGSAAAGRTSDWIGRRYTIVLAAIFFFFGSLLMGFASSYGWLMGGRFVAGIGSGYALVIAPVYTAEVSPTASRGFLTSFPEIFINLGILLGYVSNVAFAHLPEHLGWRFMLGIGAIPSIILALGVLAMPESPRWLVLQGRLGEAREILYKTSDSHEEALDRLTDIKQAAGISPDCHDDVCEVPKNSHGQGVWKELLISPTPVVLHIVIAGLGIHFFQQISGIDAVVLYSPKIFEKAGLTSKTHKLLATVLVGFIKTCFILVATFMLDRFGRRPLLLTSVGGMIISLATLATCLTVVEHSHSKLTGTVALAIVSVLFYVAAFSIGIGPIVWVYSSEIFPLRLRSQGTGLGVAVNRIMSGTVSMTFLSLSNAITIGGAFYVYMGFAIIAWIFCYTLLPETRNRTLEDIGQLFGTFFNWRTTMKELETKEMAANNGHHKGEFRR